ncbi:MAG: F0F1 ATP synthase subunit epsilon [candidate division Zixibacteria bacterium]
MFKLSVVTPEKIVFEQDVRSIIAPGSEGYLGVLTDHAPLITPLTSGSLTVIDADNKKSEYCVGGGFLEVSGNVATVLADAIETTDEINIERAKEAEKRARERLVHRSDREIDTARAEAALARALNRLKATRLKS